MLPIYLAAMYIFRLRTALSVCAAALAISVSLNAQTNINFVGQLSYQDLHNSDLSNLWGYTDEEGNEYALVGVNGNGGGEPGGISVVDLSDPSDPQEIYFFEGPASIWREIKVWEDHAYITTEAQDGGLTIVDLSPLPQSTALSTTVYNDPGWNTSHALFIDENGRLYLFGSSEGNGGVIMYDLTQDPNVPVRVGEYDPIYVHDGYARGDTLYAGHIYNGYFSIVDVSDPSAPVLLGTQSTPSNFTHNVWLDDSGDHLYTTDERDNAYVGSYDISDPMDIQYLDKLQSDPGSNAIPHNTYWLPSHHVVQSYYTYGVTIYDVTRPDNMVEVGNYDTSPFTGGGFFGAWGVYPFFSSGRLIISDIEGGLFILDPAYVRACWLEGNITDSGSNAPVAQATVSLATTSAFDLTTFDGVYGTGWSTSGTYEVTVSAPGYYPQTVGGVVLVNGEVTLLDIALDPLPNYPVSGIVLELGTGTPVEGAVVLLKSAAYNFNTTTDVDGNFTFPTVYDGIYEVLAGKWGWHTACPLPITVDGAGSTGNTLEVEVGYADDFAMDLGWQVSSTASRGAWERGAPRGTFLDNVPSNPGADVTDDCSDQAFVTGNGGGEAGTDDVDEGATLLTSPVFDATAMVDPHVRFKTWFFNDGGQGDPNDVMTISLSNGSDTVPIATFDDSSPMSLWRFNNIRIADHMVPSAAMRFMVRIADETPGHVLEGGLDVFGIYPESNTGIASNNAAAGMHIWPNPATSQVTVSVAGGALLKVVDAVGREVGPALRMTGDQRTMDLDLPAGTYFIKATTKTGQILVERLVVVE